MLNKTKLLSPISIIIPTYNEKENIGELIALIKKYTLQDDEIIIVDDDSPDKTFEVVKNITDTDFSVKLIHRRNEKGLGSAINTGIKSAKNSIVLWMDADFSMPPSEIPKLREQLNSFDICIGSRYIKDGKDSRGLWLHGLLSFWINKICYYCLSRKIKDWTSSYVCAKKEIFYKITLKGFYGEYCIDFLYRAIKMNYTVSEIPYICVNRIKGNSKTFPNFYTLFNNGFKYLVIIVKLKLKNINDKL